MQILHGYRREWTEDDIISILDELTSMHFNTPQKKINSSFSLYQQLYAEELFLIPAQINIYHLVVLRNILIFFFHFEDSPEEWMAENVAHLFILCGDVITSKMLISKAINGRTVELSTITTSFCVVKIS